MQLSDGLKHYKENEDYFAWATKLEIEAKEILQLIDYRKAPAADDQDLKRVKNFLIEVAIWKALGAPDKTTNAAKNNTRQIWEAISNAMEANNANDDEKTLSAIQRLTGFGQGNGSTKVASAVLRFLWPEKWGVVDWRISEMISLLKKNSWDIDKSLQQAKSFKPTREDKDAIIPKAQAIEFNKLYRNASKELKNDLPRAADVDMAIFGLSLIAWPLTAKKNKKC